MLLNKESMEIILKRIELPKVLREVSIQYDLKFAQLRLLHM